VFRAPALALIALVVVPAPGCAGDSEPAVVRDRRAHVTVDARDNRFDPARIEIDAGTTVEWVNVGRASHNVLPVTGDAFGVKTSRFGPRKRYAHRFDDPGVFKYWCSLHGSRTRGMIGEVVVLESGDGRRR
jgi:plastocyanin